jgi:poly(hydroxyalkanoate) depolymerase family esterase
MLSRLARIVTVIVAVVLLVPAAAAHASHSSPQPGQMVKQTYTNAAGTRTYYVYVPTSGGASKPVMVWLHGCGGPLTMQAGHALAQVAQEDGFTLVYPVQDLAANPGDCWNWFVPSSMRRGSGEASIIAGITTTVTREVGGDPGRIYIGGYSAGGAMSTVMGATYPDLYAAIAPSAGAPYAFDLTGSQAYGEMGPRARPVPAWILQGLTDEISNYVIGRTNILQWLGTDDHADDGANNGSVSRLPSGLNLPIVRTGLLPLPLIVEHYTSPGCELAQFLTSPYEHLINGYFISTDSGLGLERLMMDFLLAHRLGAVHHGCG